MLKLAPNRSLAPATAVLWPIPLPTLMTQMTNGSNRTKNVCEKTYSKFRLKQHLGSLARQFSIRLEWVAAAQPLCIHAQDIFLVTSFDVFPSQLECFRHKSSVWSPDLCYQLHLLRQLKLLQLTWQTEANCYKHQQTCIAAAIVHS